MRALCVSAALLAALFVLSLLNSFHIARQTDQWLRVLEQVDAALDEENWPAASAAAREIRSSWLRQQFYFHTVIHHAELDEADTLFLQLLVLCDEEDTAEARLHLADLRSQLRLLAEMQELSLTNIL